MSEFKRTISEDYLLSVQRGDINEASITWKFGYHISGGTGLETIWDGNGLYPYPLDYGVNADFVDIVSSNASDTLEMAINGLDEAGNLQTEIVTLAGTTPTTTINKFSRVFRGWNDDSVDLIGDISYHKTGQSTDPYMVAKVLAEEQQTLMAVFTIPLGYTGYLLKGTTNIGSGKEAIVTFSAKKYGNVFRTQEKFPIFESSLEAQRPFNAFPELTDIEVRAETGTSGTSIDATFGVLLEKN